MHTHSSKHTYTEQWAANAAAPGEQLGVPCSRVSPQSWYLRWKRALVIHSPHLQSLLDLRLESTTFWVTSPTLYPLGHNCPTNLVTVPAVQWYFDLYHGAFTKNMEVVFIFVKHFRVILWVWSFKSATNTMLYHCATWTLKKNSTPNQNGWSTGLNWVDVAWWLYMRNLRSQNVKQRLWLSGRTLRQLSERLWVRFPGNTCTNKNV